MNHNLLIFARIIRRLGIELFAALMLGGCILLVVAMVGLVAQHGFWYVASAVMAGVLLFGAVIGLAALFTWANDVIKESKGSR